jgi:L,D-transpeptidase ErfK/SrfK
MGHLNIRAQQLLSTIPPIRILITLPGQSTRISGMLKHAFRAIFFFMFILIALVLMLVIFYLLPDNLIRWSMLRSSQGYVKESGLTSDTTVYQQYQTRIEKDLVLNEKKLNSLTTQKPYIVINTTTNTFKLYKAGEIIREGNCSTGSYVKLRSKENKEWIFKTPKGYRTIKYKTTKPVWKKPDWAFVEEGLPIPSPNHPSRFEYGVLGDYALYMGEGYMIHGTLYQRLLGLPVTHGCIRLGDSDLEIVYRTLGSGSIVFII